MKFSIIIAISVAMLSPLIASRLFAQVNIELGKGPQYQAATVSVYGPGSNNKTIPLNRIRGTRFLSEEWQLASLYDSNAKRIKIVPGRMNLVTHEFHFMWKEKELVADDDNKITLIVFHENDDTSLVSAVFIKNVPNLLWDNNPLKAFVQVMNSGKYQLLKYTSRNPYPAEDSLFGTQKRYAFKDLDFYYLKDGDKVKKIKKLNDDHLLALLPDASAYKSWIDQNNLNFKKEEDVLRFLDYYNTQTNLSAK